MTPIEFNAILAATPAGQVVRLKGVCEGQLRLRAEALSGRTIDARGATIKGGLYPSPGVQKLTIIGGTWGPIRLDDSKNIRISKIAGVGLKAGHGVYVVKGEDIQVEGCTFTGFKTGVGLVQVDGFNVSHVDFSGMTSDGLQLDGSRNGTVSDINCHDFTPALRAHADAVQFTTSAAGVCENITIIRVKVDDPKIQGVCGFDGPYRRITIEDCEVRIGVSHAIALNDGEDCRIWNNRVSTHADFIRRASINTHNCKNLVRMLNTVEAGAGKPGIADAEA